MNNSDKVILVKDATGRQGGAVAHHQCKNNFTFKALTRTPCSNAALLVVSNAVIVVNGDMADSQSLLSAIEGCYGVFSIQNYFEYGAENEIKYGKNMADAAK